MLDQIHTHKSRCQPKGHPSVAAVASQLVAFLYIITTPHAGVKAKTPMQRALPKPHVTWNRPLASSPYLDHRDIRFKLDCNTQPCGPSHTHSGPFPAPVRGVPASHLSVAAVASCWLTT